MGNTSLEKLSTLVEKELDTLMAKGTLTPPELDTAKKAVELMAKIKEYEAMCMEEEQGTAPMYSERRHYTMHYPMNYSGGSYDQYGMHSMTGGNNYGGYSEVRRDSMGRYSGHSIKDRMIDKLERMMDEAGSEYERKEIMEEISRLRQNN